MITFSLLFSAFAVCLLWSLWGHGSVQFYWASWTAHSLSRTFSREWDPTVQLPQALKIALNFPSLCLCSLEPQSCWMSQLLQGDIAAEIRQGLCKRKSKDPLVASWETSKRSKDESVTHFLSPCWLLTTLGNPQGCVGIKSPLSKSCSRNFSGNERWRTLLLREQTLESEPWSSWEVTQPWWGCGKPEWAPATPSSSKPLEKEAPSKKMVPENPSQFSQLFGCHSLFLHSKCLCGRDEMTSANAMIGVEWQGYKAVCRSFLQLQ